MFVGMLIVHAVAAPQSASSILPVCEAFFLSLFASIMDLIVS